METHNIGNTEQTLIVLQDIIANIPGRIRLIRTKLGLTQKELGQMLDPIKGRDAIKNYENGRCMPNADVFLKILVLLIEKVLRDQADSLN